MALDMQVFKVLFNKSRSKERVLRTSRVPIFCWIGRNLGSFSRMTLMFMEVELWSAKAWYGQDG